jgi:hypothetical protein
MLVFKTNHHTPTFIWTNSEMEQLHLLNKLEQFCHVDQILSDQLVFIPHVKPIELKKHPQLFNKESLIHKAPG